MDEVDILLVLRDDKPIFHLDITPIYHSSIYTSKAVDRVQGVEYYENLLSLIQIAESDRLDSYIVCGMGGDSTCLNTISERIEKFNPLYEVFIEIIRNFIESKPYIKTGLVRQVLEIGSMELYYYCFYIRIDPSNYKSIIDLLKTMDYVAKHTNRMINVFIATLSQNSGLIYRVYSEFVGVLRYTKFDNIKIELIKPLPTVEIIKRLLSRHVCFLAYLETLIFTSIHDIYSYILDYPVKEECSTR